MTDRIAAVCGLIYYDRCKIEAEEEHARSAVERFLNLHLETRDETDLASHFAWIPEGVDILITHTPPFVEDRDVDVSLQTQSPHFGSCALAMTIARVKPKLAFCGHIHTGDHRVHDMVHEKGLITKIYNVSRLDASYAVAYEPFVSDL